MPRRERLSPAQRAALVGIPTDREGLTRHYTLSARDRERHRGSSTGTRQTRRFPESRLGRSLRFQWFSESGFCRSAADFPIAVSV